MSAISASFRGLSQQSHLLRGWSFTLMTSEQQKALLRVAKQGSKKFGK
jgi:hypothetical protein